jgi:hypothetical protein
MTCSIALALFVVFVSFYYFQSRAAISGNKPICQGGRLLTSLSRERIASEWATRARRSLKFMLLALERRRIAHPKAEDYADFQRAITAGICDGRNGVKVQFARQQPKSSADAARAARGHPERAQDYRPRARLDRPAREALKSGAILPATAAAVLGTSALYGHQLDARQ